MEEPFLIIGLRLQTTSPGHLNVFEKMMTELEQLLSATVLTELKASGVYVAQLKGTNARITWKRVAELLSRYDATIGDDLQWFVTLADRHGCELAYN